MGWSRSSSGSRGRWVSIGVPIAAAILWAATIALDGGFHVGDRAMVHLGEGAVWTRVVTAGGSGQDSTVDQTFYPDDPPRGGLGIALKASQCPELPSIHRVFVSTTGEWWTVRLPFWFALLVTVAVSGSPVWRGRSSHKEPRVCPSGCAGWLVIAPGITATALILATWVASGWLCFDACGYRAQVFVNGGVFELWYDVDGCVCVFDGPYWRPHWYAERSFEMRWAVPHTSDCAQSTMGSWREVVIPLWAPLMLVGLPTLWMLWSRRRRRPPGHCVACGYDLTGNVSGRCPECGTLIVATVPPHARA